jgi:EAL domain-containing protein (putative c-di-GMP-specific phosphodiesterase class I)
MAQSRLDLSAELRHAIRRDEIQLLYQPCVDLASGRVVAADTVVRWKHASGRVVEGDELMDLAGSSEMDVVLTEWAFEEMRRHAKNWRAAGLQPVTVAMKVSLADMRPTDLGYLVNAAIAGGIEPQGLSLALQQVGAIDNLPAGEAAAMLALRKKGVRLALDRFGHTASVAHLRRLMCDEIRVDASFLRDLQQDEAVQPMLLGMGDLARRLRLACVACGIDTPAQLAFLKKNGWDRGQGAMFDTPLSGLAFAAKWLTRSGKAARVALPGNGA